MDIYRITPLLIVFLVTLTFHNILLNQFSYDDELVIVENQQNLGKIENITCLFSNNYFTISKEGSYRPLVTASYFWDQYLWGPDPLGFHFTNLFFHLLNAILVYYLFRRLCSNELASIASTLLYVVHPALTEAVNSPGFREDLIATTFVFLSILLYMRESFLLSIISYCLALLSKESAFPLPLLIISYDYLYKQKSFPRRYLWFFLTALFYLYIRFFLFYNPLLEKQTTNLPILIRFTSIPSIIFYYIRLLLFPIPLSADYATFDFILNPNPYLTAISIIVLLIFLLQMRRGAFDRAAIFGICWFLFTLIPVLNIIPIVDPFAERFVYLPAVGFALFLGNLFMTKAPNYIRLSLVLFIVLSFSVITYQRNNIWKDWETLWGDTVKKSPKSFRGSLNISAAMIKQMKYDAAISALKDYLSKVSEAPSAIYFNLGTSYLLKEDYDLAILNLSKAVSLDSLSVNAHLNLASAFAKKNEFKKALDEVEEVIKISPNNVDAFLTKGFLYGEQGQLSYAEKAFEKARTIDRNAPNIHYNIGLLCEKRGLYKKAHQEYLKEIEINPLHKEAKISIGRLLTNSGKRKKAVQIFETVLREEPDNKEVRSNLALIRELNKK